jgi:hypothetical protein
MESFLGGRYQLDDLQLCDSMIWIVGVGVVPDNLAMHDSTSFVAFREIASLKWIILNSAVGKACRQDKAQAS